MSLRADLEGRLTDGLYGVGWAAVKTLPEPAARALFRTLADQVWRRRGRSVLRLESNLARVVPDADPIALAALSRAGMRSYMRYWMESFRLPTWSAKRIKDSIDVEGAHWLTEGLDAGRGVILALPHLANWDLAGAWVTTDLKVPFTTVAERLKPESLYDRFVAYREGLGMEVLAHTGAAAAVGWPRLPGCRPRPVGVRCRGRLLRRRRTHARGPRAAGPADRCPAAARHPLVRRHAGDEGAGPSARHRTRDR